MAGIDNASSFRSKEDEERLARQKAKNPTNVSRARELAKQYSNPYKFSNTVTVKKTINNEKWYSGDKPTARETYARMYQVANGDEERFNELQNMWNQEISSPGSVIYNPYTQATNSKAINGLRELGVEVPDVITDQWVDDMWTQYSQYARGTTTGYGPAAPSSKSTRENDIAYWTWALSEAKENTNLAETQMQSLYDEVSYLANRGYSDDEIVKQVRNEFGSKYNVLNQMDERRVSGDPDVVRLNRTVDYNGDDTIYGMIWAARNDGGTGNFFEDAVSYALGWGNKYKADSASEAARDPSSADYDPYAQGNMHEMNIKYGVNEFNWDWLNANKAMLSDPDKADDYRDIKESVENADLAAREQSALDQWIEKQVSSGKTAEDIIASMEATVADGGEVRYTNADGKSETIKLSTLSKMENKREDGLYLNLGYGVDFTLTNYIAKVNDMVAERDAAVQAEAEAKAQQPGVFENIKNMVTGRDEQAKEDFGAIIKKAGRFLASMGIPGIGSYGDAIDDALAAQEDAYDADSIGKNYASSVLGVDIRGDLNPYEKNAVNDMVEKVQAATAPHATEEEIEAANVAIAAVEDLLSQAAADPSRQEAESYTSKESWKSVAEKQPEEPREGMVDMVAEPTAYTGASSTEEADSEYNEMLEAYRSMCQGGEWNNEVMSWALSESNNATAIRAEIGQGIIDHQAKGAELTGLAKSWWDKFGGLVDDIGGPTDYSQLVDYDNHPEKYDSRRAYGTQVYDMLEANSSAYESGAIGAARYADNLMMISSIADGISQMTGGERATDEQAARYLELSGAQEQVEYIYGSIRGGVQQLAQNEAEKSKQVVAENMNVISRIASGEVSDDDIASYMSIMTADTSFAMATDATYQETSAYISEALGFDSIAESGINFTTGDKNVDAAYGKEWVLNEGAAVYSKGVSALAQSMLDTNMKYAAACNLSLEAFYEKFPSFARTPEQLVAEARTEYNGTWREFGHTLEGLTEATDSILNAGEDAEAAGEQNKNELDFSDTLALAVDKVARSNALNLEKALYMMRFGWRDEVGRVDLLKDQYNNDRSAYAADLDKWEAGREANLRSVYENDITAQQSGMSYEDWRVENTDKQLDEIRAKRETGTDIFDIGQSIDELNSQQAIVEKTGDVAAVDALVKEYGSEFDQMVFDGVTSLIQTGEMLVTSSLTGGGYAGSLVATLVSSGGDAYDRFVQSGDYDVAMLASVGTWLVNAAIEQTSLDSYIPEAFGGKQGQKMLAARSMLQREHLYGMIKDPKALSTAAQAVLEAFIKGGTDAGGEGLEETLQALVDSFADNVIYQTGYLLSSEQVDEALKAGASGFAMAPFISLPFSSLAGRPKVTDYRGDLISKAEGQPLPETDGIVLNEAIAFEAANMAYVNNTEALAQIEASSENAAKKQAEAELATAETEVQKAETKLADVQAEHDAAASALEAADAESKNSEVFTEEISKRMVAAATALNKSNIDLEKARADLSTAQGRREAAQQKRDKAAAKVQTMYNQVMDEAKAKYTQQITDRYYAGDSEEQRAAGEAYQVACKNLQDAKNNLRSAKADLEIYSRGTPKGDNAGLEYGRALNAVDDAADAVADAKAKMDAAYASTPEAKAEAGNSEAFEKALQAADEAMVAAEADPMNERKQLAAEHAQAQLETIRAKQALEEKRADISIRLKSPDSKVREQAVQDWKAAQQRANAAEANAKAIEAEFNETDTQKRLKAAIENMKQFENEDLIDERSENHEAAVKAYAELEFAMRESEYENAQKSVYDAALAVDAKDSRSIQAYKDASATAESIKRDKGLNGYDYDSLISKPDMQITELPEVGVLDRKQAVAEGKQNVLKYSDRTDMNGAPAMFIKDLGKYVIVGKQSLQHGMDRRAGEQGTVISRIGDILNSSIVVNEAIPKKDGVKNSYILLGVARNPKGEMVYIRSVVNQSTMQLEDIASLYAVYGKKRETSRDLAANAWPNDRGIPSGFTISVAEMLDGVKDHFSDILSDDVLNELGATRVESEFSESLKYKQSDIQAWRNTEAGFGDHRTPARTGEVTTADKNPIEILSDLTRSIRVGYNPGGSMSVDGERLPRAVQGFYNRYARAITTRTSEAGDLTIGLHEFGHAVQQRLNGLRANDQLINNLNPDVRNAYDPIELDGEAVAEFVVDYIFNRDEAVRMAGSQFVQDFEDMLRTDRRLYTAIMDASHQTELWNNADIGSKIDSVTKDSLDPKRGQIGNRFQQTIRNIETAVFDQTAPASLVSRDFRQQTLYSMHARQRADVSLTKFLIDPQGRNIGKSFAERFYDAGVTEADLPEISRYALARHALDRLRQGKPVFDEHEFPAEELQRLVDDTEANKPNIVAGADAITSFWNDYLDAWWVNTGMIDAAAVKRMREMYPHYVPTFRVMGNNFKDFGGESARFQMHSAVQGGSSLEVINPVASIIKMTQQMTSTVTHNQMMRAFHAEMQRGGLGDIATNVTQIYRSRYDTRAMQTQLEALNASGTVDPALMDDAFAELQLLQQQWYGVNQNYAPGVVSGIDENGNQFFYAIRDDGLYNLLSGNTAAATVVPQCLRNFKNTFTQLTTGRNPLFAFKNMRRDFQNSVNTGTWALTYADGMYRWIQAMRDIVNNDQTYQDWVAMGGGEHSYVSGKLNAEESGKLTKEIGKMLLRGKETERGFKVDPTRLEKISSLVTMEQLNNLIENTSRFVEYKYGKHDLTTDEGRREAFMASQDVTTNFGTHGALPLIQILSQVTPFMNASLQGLYKDIRLVKDAFSSDASVRSQAWTKVGKTLMNVALAAALQRALLEAYGGNDDDEDYALLSQEMRLGNLIIPIPKAIMNAMGNAIGFDKPYIRVVLSNDVLTQAVYASISDLIANVTDYSPMEVDLLTAARSIISNALPDGTILKAINDAANNKTWYGSAIESEYIGGRSDGNRYDASVPTAVVTLGRVLHVSPAKLNYVLNQYSGFVGKLIMPLISKDRLNTDEGWTLSGGLKNLTYNVLKNYTIDPASSNELNSRYSSIKKTVGEIITDGDAGMPMNNLAYNVDADEAYAAAKTLQNEFAAIDEDISAAWAEWWAIRDDDLNDGEKTRRMRDIRENQINAKIEEAIALYEEYKMYYIDNDTLAQAIVDEVQYVGGKKPTLD